jgi:hypothetical protein
MVFKEASQHLVVKVVRQEAGRSQIADSRKSAGLVNHTGFPQKVGELPVGLDDVVVEPVFDHMQQRMSGFYQ